MDTPNNNTNTDFKVVEQLGTAVENVDEKAAKIRENIRKYGRVPVIYGPTKAMAKPSAKEGLIQLILKSGNRDEIEAIVTKATAEYKNAHPSTIRKWNRVAQDRIKQLSPN